MVGFYTVQIQTTSVLNRTDVIHTIRTNKRTTITDEAYLQAATTYPRGRYDLSPEVIKYNS